MPSHRATALLIATVTCTSTLIILMTSTQLAVPAVSGAPAGAMVLGTAPVTVMPPRPVVRPVPPVPRLPEPQVPAVGVVRRHRSVPHSTTPRDRLDAAVARIPGYRPGEATWVLTGAYRAWGAADWYDGRVYISPSVPSDRIYDVVAHEWSHLLSVEVYGGDVNATVAALNQWFGGHRLEGAERAADCMARLLGARWTHYTSCSDPHWRDGARRLVARHRLPASPTSTG